MKGPSEPRRAHATGPTVLGVAALTLALCACGGSSPSGPAAADPPAAPAPTPPPPPPPPPGPVAPDGPIPRLAPGPHWGVITGFDDLSARPGEPDRAARAEALRGELAAAGESIGRAQLDWSELEPSRGVYDAATLEAALTAVSTGGRAPYLTLSTLDSFDITLPAYLMDGDGALAPGLSLDSPEVLEAFEAFLDWLVPRLADHEVWGLSLGNETDVLVDDGIVDPQAALTFFTRGAERAKALDPDLAVTVTFTETADDALSMSFLLDDYLAAFDIVAFNFYCSGEDFLVRAPAEWDAVIDRWLDLAEGKAVFIQELGCPAGYGDDGAGAPARPPGGLGASPEIQADFFAHMAERFRDEPQLRASTAFQLFDWSPGLAASFGDILRDDGLILAGDRFEEALATIGLCRWADATCREAWDVFLDGVDTLRNERGAASGAP